MTDTQIQRLIKQLEHIESSIQNLKDEFLIAMMMEQNKLLELKYDRKDYHYHFHDPKRINN